MRALKPHGSRYKGVPLGALFAVLVLFFGCGKGGDNRTGSIKYFLAQPATSTITNTFTLQVEGEFKPSFSLSGSGYTAGIPFDTITPFQELTEIKAETFGNVSVLLTLYQENGKAYLTDSLLWKSSGEVPPKPLAYFSEAASADAYVYLVLPTVGKRGKNTTEVFVEGDVIPAAGAYYTIPADDQVLIKLSDRDGLKTAHVKYRNIFGAHSISVDVKVIRKTVGPTDCKAIPVARKTSSGSIRTRIQAINEGPLSYKIAGAVAVEKDFASFTDSIEDFVALSGAEGVKHLVVKIKDEAGNACDDIPLTITYDRSYVPGAVTIANDPIWTDDPSITIVPHFDHLEGDKIEMYVSGNILPSPTTLTWIPYAESLPLTLTPTSGSRHVIVQFRIGETILSEVTDEVFLRPYVLVSGVIPSLVVIPGQIVGTVSLTISGCQEVYSHVAYQAQYPCTPAASDATATYYFSDGTTLTRFTAF